MCTLLANLLDNAIEANEQIGDGNRWIYLKIKRKNDMLLIWVENLIAKGLINKDNFFETSKENKIFHGLGIKSIDNVIQKYSGYKEFDIQENKFQIYISIPIE